MECIPHSILLFLISLFFIFVKNDMRGSLFSSRLQKKVTEAMVPRLGQLSALVSRIPYRGDDDATASRGVKATNHGERPTLAELVRRVQASEGEIRTALANMHAIEVQP